MVSNNPPIAKNTPKVGYQVLGKIGALISKAPVQSVQNYGNRLQADAGAILNQIKAVTPKVTPAYAEMTQKLPPLFTQDQLKANQAMHPIGPENYTTGTGLGAPSTGGQTTGGNLGGGGSFDFGSTLRDAYDRSRSALEGLLPTYENDFNNYKSSVEGTINDAKNTLNTQIGDVTKRYGDTLKNLLNTSKDLRQRTSSTFSGLGALDSSAYQDELIKQEQADKQGISNIDLAQQKDITGLNDTFNTYERDQKGKILSYQEDINRAKAGVRQAMANGDIEQAQTLANYAMQVQNNIDNMKLQLASAQASGVDVMGALRKINGVDFNNTFGQALGNRYNSALSRYVIPSAGAQGQGYIASSRNPDEQRRLLGLA